MMDLLFCLVAALLVARTQSCPEVCRCVAKQQYGSHIADCSYKDLQAVPAGLPTNATSLSLSVNRITSLREGSFKAVANLQALWLSHNNISSIAKDTFASLVQLKGLDLSHNQLTDFPWQDLHNLTALQLLKLSNNFLANVPREAFYPLKDLQSLWLNGNRLTVLSEGTFDFMPLSSQLQINSNPFHCACPIWWLQGWLESTSVSIPEKDSITCATPENLRGLILGKTLKLDCMLPSVQLTYRSNLDNTVLLDGLTLLLHCTAVGKPQPEVRWKIQTPHRNTVINGANVDEENNVVADATTKQSKGQLLVFKNGSMAISKFSKADEGTYSCLATNEVGSREVSVNVALHSSEDMVDDLLQNTIQASKPRTKTCDKEDLPKSEDKVVFIYLNPVKPVSSSNGMTLWVPWLRPGWFGAFLLVLHS